MEPEYTTLEVFICPVREFARDASVGVHRRLESGRDVAEAIDRALNHGHSVICFYTDVSAELLVPYFEQFWTTSQISPADRSFEIAV
jgi:hypothetical protein